MGKQYLIEVYPPEISNMEGEVGMQKYECTVCGYIYDPELGDPDGGVAPGTPFEDRTGRLGMPGVWCGEGYV
jgi:hypothetical protein